MIICVKEDQDKTKMTEFKSRLPCSTENSLPRRKINNNKKTEKQYITNIGSRSLLIVNIYDFIAAVTVLFDEMIWGAAFAFVVHTDMIFPLTNYLFLEQIYKEI